MELASGRGLPDEEHVDLSSLNDEICSEYEEQKFELNEEIEIPPEEEPQLDQAEIQRRTDYEEYFSLMELTYPAELAANDERRIRLVELFHMGF